MIGQRLKLTHKFVLILVLPLAGIFHLGLQQVRDRHATYREMEQIERDVYVAVAASAMVHEVQRERGLTAGYLGSKGTRFAGELATQRDESDRRVHALRQALADAGKEGGSGKWQAVLERLAGLHALRADVGGQAVATAAAVSRYTAINGAVLTLLSEGMNGVTDGSVANGLTGYAIFLNAKEDAGIERAVFNGVFASDRFAAGVRNRTVSLVASQEALLGMFRAIAQPAQVALFDERMDAPPVRRVMELREVALGRDMGFGVEPAAWFEAASGRIDRMKQVEDRLSDDLLTTAGRLREEAFSAWLGTLAVGVGAFGVSLAVSFLLLRQLLGQILALQRCIQHVERESDLTRVSEVRSGDEVGQAANAFNSMLLAFRTTVHEVIRSVSSLAAAAEEMSAVAREADTGIGIQTRATEEVVVSMNQMAQAVGEIAESTCRCAQAAEQAEREGNDSKVVMVEAIGVTDRLADEVMRAEQAVGELVEVSSEINTVLDVIRSVAEQTNLLALNASIEAARAGDQGRGFAVVASEVRTLAQRVHESTNEIQGMVGRMRSASGGAVARMEEVRGSAADSVARVERSAESMAMISGELSTIRGMVQQIAAATEEQRVVAGEVSRSITSVREVAVRTSSGVDETLSASGELARVASVLKESVERFRT